MSDDKLLAQYARDGSQGAFGQIVARHLSLVYSTCLRELGSPSLAEDAAQVVFLLLARKARSLRAGPSLAGWLYKAARFVAKDVRKQERRRQLGEERVMSETTHKQEPFTPECPSIGSVEPFLNDALSALKAGEREAVLLRFIEGHSLAETGAALGLSEDAARMRVTRAVEKMRRHLTAHGAAVTGLVLMGFLTAEAARPAPASAAAITQAALLAISAGPTANVLLLSKGVYQTMKIIKVKVAVLAAAALLAGAALPPLARALSPHKASVRVLAAPVPLTENVTMKFTLDKGQHAFYSATLPEGASMLILDAQRAGGKSGDLKCRLLITDKDAARLRGSANATGSFEARDDVETEGRIVTRSVLKKPKSVLFDVRNLGGQCQYWLTVLHAAPALLTSASEASSSASVPLFGTVVPTRIVVGETKTGSLAGNGNAYFLITLKAGRYQSFLNFSNVGGKPTELNGTLVLTDEVGFPLFYEAGLPPMPQTVFDNDIHFSNSPYQYQDNYKFTLERDGTFLVRIENQSDRTGHSTPVNFTARILPDGAASAEKQN